MTTDLIYSAIAKIIGAILGGLIVVAHIKWIERNHVPKTKDDYIKEYCEELGIEKELFFELDEDIQRMVMDRFPDF